ncbi:MAG TPA: DUF6596 domain-containing protein [Pricia sp.]|nr:DUF6596 domain-containing protein [Pricia sp.]
METKNELLQGLFRKEFSKMVAVIGKYFSLQHIEIAEDVVSETFLQASETWGTKGIPENPAAWLYVVAKQKTLSHFRRNKIFTEKVLPKIKESAVQNNNIDLDFSNENIQDSQLQMLFAVCNPAIVSEAQIGLALRILCGFGIGEIAEAFLSNKETINKRLFRAKEKLRLENIKLEMPPETEIGNRLDNVLHIIYLLFNEGYYSNTQNQVLCKDFCLEAMRLGILLTKNEKTNLPKTNALMAMMCFHTSRFNARQTSNNGIILYDRQNEKLWDKELIAQGNVFLDKAVQGNEITSYHLEAGIAFWHCQKNDTAEKWKNILHHYNLLLEINYSPSVALNRVYALYKAKGREVALPEAEKLQFTKSHFYFTLLGKLYKGVDNQKAKQHYDKALGMAKTQTDRQTLKKKLENLKN